LLFWGYLILSFSGFTYWSYFRMEIWCRIIHRWWSLRWICSFFDDFHSPHAAFHLLTHPYVHFLNMHEPPQATSTHHSLPYVHFLTIHTRLTPHPTNWRIHMSIFWTCAPTTSRTCSFIDHTHRLPRMYVHFLNIRNDHLAHMMEHLYW
jgi:hypothetical protein